MRRHDWIRTVRSYAFSSRASEWFSVPKVPGETYPVRDRASEWTCTRCCAKLWSIGPPMVVELDGIPTVNVELLIGTVPMPGFPPPNHVSRFLKAPIPVSCDEALEWLDVARVLES
jgi:hypothetical protein